MLVELQLIKNLKAFNARHAGKVIMQVNCYWNTNVMENHENNLAFLNMSCLIFYCGPHILFWSSLWFISRTGVILRCHATGAEANARWTLLFPRVYYVSRVHLTGVFGVFVCAKMVNSEAARGLGWKITPVLQVKKVDSIFSLINRLS